MTDCVLDLNHRETPSELFSRIVFDKYKELKDAEPARKYLGGSRIGFPCARALQFEYLHAPKDTDKGFSGNLYSIFQRGHWAEDHTIALMRQAGFTVLNEKPGGGQFGFSLMNGRIKGHCDGIVTAGPEGFGPYPLLFEHKAVGDSSWKKFAKDGVKKTSGEYHGQIVVYQHQLELTDNPAMFVVLNANTMAYHVERVPFEPDVCQELYDKAHRIITCSEAGELLPRIAKDESHYICKSKCSYVERFFSLPY